MCLGFQDAQLTDLHFTYHGEVTMSIKTPECMIKYTRCSVRTQIISLVLSIKEDYCTRYMVNYKEQCVLREIKESTKVKGKRWTE